MIPTQKHCALGDATVATDGYLSEVFNPNMLSDPTGIADGQVPWGLDLDARFEDHIFAYMPAEEANQHGFYAGWPGNPRLEKDA